MTVVAVVVAVLPYPFVAFYVLLITLFGTAVLSRFGPARAQSFWRWFSACGWLYVFVCTSLIDKLESTLWWRATRDWLQQNNPVGLMWSPEKYLMFAHSLIALSIAIAGGILIPLLIRACRHKLVA